MKRIIAILLFTAMLLSSFSLVVFAEDGEKEPWEIYDNYLCYNNGDGHKTGGYLITGIVIGFNKSFYNEHKDEIDENLFPEIADKTVQIEVSTFTSLARFYFSEDPYAYDESVYTTEDIDAFIEILKYVKSFPFVDFIEPSGIIAMTPDLPPIPITDTDAENEKESWEIYDNYMFYDNEDNHKTSGYLATSFFVEFTADFYNAHKDEISKDLFPEISDKIVSITSYESVTTKIFFQLVDESTIQWESLVYTTEDIDRFIDILKYVNSFSFVEYVRPNSMWTVTPDLPPIPITDTDAESETEPETDVVTETDTETESETEAIESETEAPTAGTEKESEAENDKKTLKNPQTGDRLFLYVSIGLFALSALVFAAALKKSIQSK